MSPASKSKSKEKRAVSKDPQKASGKSTGNPNTSIGVPTSGYNPLLGTFQTLDTAPSSAPSILVNGRFRNIDDTSDHNGNSVATGVEYDSVSNNGSWSGESEDPRDKTSQGPTQESIPGADTDRREKIRQKNEKKHQRQKERRAQELHEKCSGYLMSRKLETLSQQLVAMGFSSERATMALILNEGRVEESVAWLLEGGEEEDTSNQREHNLGNGNLKIDISQELARVAEMEIKFKCSKQEVERAIVASEGDLDQAAETLGVQKQEPPKPEKTGDPANGGNNGKQSVAISTKPLTLTTQSKSTPSVASTPIQQKRDDKDFNYARTAVTVGPPPPETGSKNVQLLKKDQPKAEWGKQQQFTATTSADKRWPVASPASSPSQASPLTSKTEPHVVMVGNELKNLQLGSVREPVVMMQRPQIKQIPATSVSSSPVTDWRSGGGAESVTTANRFPSHAPTTTRSFSPPSYGGSIRNQFYDHFHFQRQQQQPQHYVSNGGPLDHPRQLATATATANHGQTLVAATSLGLFSGLGSNRTSGRSSPTDWRAGGSQSLSDYANIDWSLDRAPSSSSWPSGTWRSSGDPYARPAMRPAANGGSSGMHSDVVGVRTTPETSAAGGGGGGSLEWSSPFEEKDLFNLHRQFVSSPSL